MDAIDVHFHIVPPRFVDLVRGGDLREIVDVERTLDADRLTFRPPPGIAIEPDTAIRPHLYEPRLILDALDRRGLDAAAVSPPPEFFLYWVPPELGVLIARTYNDGVAELQRAYPDRFLSLATSTCDGSNDADVQADPRDAQISCRSSPTRTGAISACPKAKLA